MGGKLLNGLSCGSEQPSSTQTHRQEVKEMTIDEVVRAVGGHLYQGRAYAEILGISIDTRSLQANELFFALQGPNYDGHQFVGDAQQRGGVGAVCSEVVNAAEDFSLILVDDTTRALQELAHSRRKRWPARVVAITGSIGKTTTKELTARLLEPSFAIFTTWGNYNNLYGLPLCLAHRTEEHDLLLLEMGMSRKGELRRLAEIGEPDIGVITNIAPVHTEFFESERAIAEAKGELIEALGSTGTAIINGDDPYLQKLVESFHGRVIRYGFEEGNQVRALSVEEMGLEGGRFLLEVEEERHPVGLPLFGRYNLSNALAALATAVALDVPVQQLPQLMKKMKPLPQRGEILRYRLGFVVVNDSYNSSPRAMAEVLHSLALVRGVGRKILVAGDMLELGQLEDDAHLHVGRAVASSDIDLFLAVGKRMRLALHEVERNGGSTETIACPEAANAGEQLQSLLRSGDLVVIKGSRAMKMEQVLEILDDHHEQEEVS